MIRRALLRAARAAKTWGGLLALLVQTTGCPEPPASDCSAKATCVPPDAGSGTPAWDASLDAGVPDAPTDAPNDAPNDEADAPAVVPTACPLGTTHVCAPPVPTGFSGPVTFWIGRYGDTAPDCPTGYRGGPYDSYLNLDAGNAECTCSCAATGQQCVSQATVFKDSNCATSCASVAVESCSPVPATCGNEEGTLRATAPVPEGGTCMPQMTGVSIPRASWTNTTRMCNAPTTADDSAYYCADAGTICVPIAGLPYQTTPCIEQTVQPGEPMPTSCPSAYPNGPLTTYPSYNGFRDTRSCAACTCSDTPVGGSCAGTISVTTVDQGDCTTGATSYPINTLGTGCVSYNLSDSIGNIGAAYTLTPGACSVVTDSMLTGTVMPMGSAQIICCM